MKIPAQHGGKVLNYDPRDLRPSPSFMNAHLMVLSHFIFKWSIRVFLYGLGAIPLEWPCYFCLWNLENEETHDESVVNNFGWKQCLLL